MKGCDVCDHGWRFITQATVDRLAPVPTPMELALLESDAEREAVLYLNSCKRAAMAWTVYPCRACQPEAFGRWAGGHLDADHNAAGCAECIELDKQHGRRRRTFRSAQRDLVAEGTSPAPPERRDLDF